MPQDLQLKYGCNPHQPFASIEVPDPDTLQILNGTPSFINVLDALNAWPLVRDLKRSTGLAAATSFKHVSPSGVAVEGDISPEQLDVYDVAEEPASPVTNAYLRAREADPKSSFGDFVAVSEIVDVPLATAVTNPDDDTVATDELDEDHVTA